MAQNILSKLRYNTVSGASTNSLRLRMDSTTGSSDTATPTAARDATLQVSQIYAHGAHGIQIYTPEIIHEHHMLSAMATTTSTSTPDVTPAPIINNQSDRPALMVHEEHKYDADEQKQHHSASILADLPAEAEFDHDALDEEQVMPPPPAHAVDDKKVIFKKALHHHRFDIWCFCCCLSSRVLPPSMENSIRNYQSRYRQWKKGKRHLGVPKFLTLTIVVWLCSSLLLAFCLLVVVLCVPCLLDGDGDVSASSSSSIESMEAMCRVHSWSVLPCDTNHSYTLYHMNLVSTECSSIAHTQLFNVSLDDYSLEQHSQCYILLDADNYRQNYQSNETFECWLHSCEDTAVHLHPTTTVEDAYEWYCGYAQLTCAILMFCVLQCCMVNLYKFLCGIQRCQNK